MTLQKVEFWITSVVALVFVLLFTYQFIEYEYMPYVWLKEQGQSAELLVAGFAAKLFLVAVVYAAFNFLNKYVFGTLYNNKKYDRVVAASVFTLAFLYATFYSLYFVFPRLLDKETFLPVIAVAFGCFLLYTTLKKLVFHVKGDYIKSHPVRLKIARISVFASLVWLAGLFIIFADGRREFVNTFGPAWGLWMPCAFILIMISVYKFLPDHFQQNKPRSYYFVKVLLTSAVLSFFFSLMFVYGLPGMLFFWVSQVVVSTPIAWFIYQHNKDDINELLFLKKELGRTSADLQFLRTQINPHFLFNALNTLYGTALQENSSRTAEGIQKLGDMMRFMLHENMQETIPVTREAEYLQNYIELQMLRTQVSEQIEITTDINETDHRHKVAPMLLIPFVENAFKHGISLQQRSWIKVSLHCQNNYLYFDVYNSLHTKLQSDPERDTQGIGLENVRQRLALLYPGKHELNIRQTGKEFIVHLTLKLDQLALQAEEPAIVAEAVALETV